MSSLASGCAQAPGKKLCRLC